MRLQRFWPALLAAGTALLCDGGAVRAEGPTASVELPRFVRPQKPKVMTDEAVDDALAVPPVEYGKWQGTGYGAYLAPKHLDVGPDGGVDVMLHLNGAMMADKEWRESGLNAVVASIAIREIVGSAGYAKLFAEPGYLDYVLRSTLADLQKNGEKRATHVRRLGVVSWSAGMGGVSQLVGNPATLARIDSVVLLDSIHATYTDPKNGVARVAVPGQAAMGLGADWVDMKAVAKYVHLASEAAQGKKAFVISASAILPPDYASCAETSRAVLRAVSSPVTELESAEKNALGMTPKYRAAKGDLHARGWRGGGPHDHFDQLHLVGEMVRTYIAPRWNRMAASERQQLTAALPGN